MLGITLIVDVRAATHVSVVQTSGPGGGPFNTSRSIATMSKPSASASVASTAGSPAPERCTPNCSPCDFITAGPYELDAASKSRHRHQFCHRGQRPEHDHRPDRQTRWAESARGAVL